MSVQRYRPRKARIRAQVSGRLPTPEFDKAIRTAQLESRPLLQSAVRFRTASKVKHRNKSAGAEDRRRGRSMVDSFFARVLADNTLSIRNDTPRFRWFEEGTEDHPIFARRGHLKFLNIPRQPGWNGQFVYPRFVQHPGQAATHVMRDTVISMVPIFERNIVRHCEQELSRTR